MPLIPVLPALAAQPRALPLHDSASSRRLEQAALACHAPHALMARAGLATARLAAAIQPHGRRAWALAGPGNNGGDALVAARHLQAWGWQVQVVLLANPEQLPADAHRAWQEAQAAAVPIHRSWPEGPRPDLVLDGLLGMGASRAPGGELAEAIGHLHRLRAQGALVLAIDLPSGLSADTGQTLGPACVQADHTLSLLTLKPGLFTAEGRDHAGRVWWDDLGVGTTAPQPPAAWLGCAPILQARAHRQHKGSQGDLLVLGGAPGMGGAAWLAARAALAAGAGRVWLGRLGESNTTPLQADPLWPEPMPRHATELLQTQVLGKATVVYGCGGGVAARAHLREVLQHAGQLVLDADGLNALAEQAEAWPLLVARQGATVLTPHPLEAARLLASTVAEVQANRLAAARALADRSQAVVLLKGSGTVVCPPGGPAVVNPTGNARLATAGTGDVLAGWLGGWMACSAVASLIEAEGVSEPAPPSQPPASQPDGPQLTRAARHAAAAAWLHGHAAERAPADQVLRADSLITFMAQAAAELPAR